MKMLRPVIIALLGMSLGGAALAAVEVGEVSYSRGVLTGQLDGEAPRLIGKGSPLHNGETLNTGSRGFALIILNDGTRMTLRPGTTFRIEDVNAAPGSENALLSLIRGGLRAVTGLISKATPRAFRIKTSVATIGIRGTEFDARLCQGNECQAEEDATGQVAQRESRVVGRIALLRGNASATEDGRQPRVLSTGAAVYERDQVQTGIKSFAVISFNDSTRVTVSPQSTFRIEEHEYRPDQPDESNAFLSFLQGGLRIVTGAIAQLNRRAFRVATPTATIGIRGTGFDLACQGACVGTSAMIDPARDTWTGRFVRFFFRPAYAQGVSDGMYARVWRGSIEVQQSQSSVVVPNGRTVFVRNGLSRPVFVPDIPGLLRQFGGSPRPDSVPFEPEFFDEVAEPGIGEGLYVNVRSGDVAVEGPGGALTHLGSGEALKAGDGRIVRLAFVPAFQKFDSIPDPAGVTVQSERLMNLFGARGASKETLECTVQ